VISGFKGISIVSVSSSSSPRPLKIGPIGCPETSITSYQSTLRNISEGRQRQFPPQTPFQNELIKERMVRHTDTLKRHKLNELSSEGSVV
jgi:hypothetical protein